MQIVKCEHCRQDVHVCLYFYNERIITHDSMDIPGEQYYEALVYGKAICPYCGKEVRELFKRTINKEDIIDLAGGRGGELC